MGLAETKKASSSTLFLTENRFTSKKPSAVESPLQNHAPAQRFPRRSDPFRRGEAENASASIRRAAAAVRSFRGLRSRRERTSPSASVMRNVDRRNILHSRIGAALIPRLLQLLNYAADRSFGERQVHSMGRQVHWPRAFAVAARIFSFMHN